MKRLSSREIDAVLREVGYGFLGVARGDRPYVLPMSFGYDGEDLYFQMNSRGRKFDYITGETPACLCAVSVDPEAGTSRSILVEGVLREVPEDEIEHTYETLAASANFGTDLSLWGLPIQEADPTLFVLRSDDVSGRVFGEERAIPFEA